MPKRLAYFLLTLIGLGLVSYGVDAVLVSTETKEGPKPIERTVSPVATSTQMTVATSTVAVVTSTNALVVKVVDGDTLDAKLDGEDKVFRIRLLGINTPETVDPRKPVECFGKQASDRMKELASDRRVRLVADPQADERDKYDRLLRNLFLEDGTDVNAAMVRDGYAYAYLSFPLNAARKRELKNLEADAKANKRGLWSSDACAK